MVGPITPLKPLQPIDPVKPLESSAPNALGPRIPGQGAPKLGERGLFGGRGRGQQIPLGLPRVQFPQVAGAGAPLPQVGLPDLSEIASQDPPVPPFDAISAPFEKPPVEHHKSFGGYLGSWKKDLNNFIMAFPALFKADYDALTDPVDGLIHNAEWIPELIANPGFMGNELWEMGKAFWSGVVDTYSDGVLEALYHHPLTVILDATTVFSILGSGIRMTARAAGATGNVAAQVKLAKLADSVATAPAKLITTPAKFAGRQTLKVPAVQTIAQRMALTPLGVKVKNLYGTHILNARARAAERGQAILSRKLSKTEHDELNRVLDGDMAWSAAKSGRVRDRAKIWQHYVMEDERFMLEWGFRSRAALEAAALKPLAMRMSRDGRFRGRLFSPGKGSGELRFSKAALDAARKWSEKHGTRPVYRPFFMQRKLDMDEILSAAAAGDDGRLLQHFGRFETKTGLGKHITDPDSYMARATIQIEELRGVMSFYAQAIRDFAIPVEKGIAKAGYVIVDPLLQKYISGGLIPTYEKLTADFVRSLQTTKRVSTSVADAVRKAKGRLQGSAAAELANIRRSVGADFGLQVPREVWTVLEANLKGPANNFVRGYTRAMNTWRSMVLSLMPRFYVNNLIGNSLLLMFGGVKPWTKSTATRNRNLPGEVMNSSGIFAVEGGAESSYIMNLIPRSGRRFLDNMAEVTDIRPRQVLFERNLKDIIKRDSLVGDTVAQSLLLHDDLDEVVSQVVRARREFLEIPEQQALAARRARVSGEAQTALGSRAVRLSRRNSARVKEIESRLHDLQRQMNRERSLSNMNPQAARGRIRDLEQQMHRLASERRAIDPHTPLAVVKGGGLSRSPELDKIARLEAKRHRLAPMAAKVDRAVAETEKFLGNYGRLHPLERRFVRQVIPFWTFAKTMNLLLFQLPFIRPKTSFLWHQFGKMMVDATNDDRLPRWLHNAVPIGGTDDGQVVFLRGGGFNPFDAASISSFGGVAIPGITDPASAPLIKVLVENRGGFDTFTNRIFTEPTDFVTMFGAVLRYDPDTREVRQLIPQKGLVRSLLDNIPHMRIVGEMLDSLGAREVARGLGAGVRRNPDGSYVYDRQPWYAVSRSLGFPITVTNPDRIKRSQAIMIRAMARRYRNASRRSDPETRAKLERILQDLESGGWEWGE